MSAHRGKADIPPQSRDFHFKAPEPAGLFWAEFDYLGWSVKGDHPPPLVASQR
jgi:hypothetical protein